jgi:hypothetical protein
LLQVAKNHDALAGHIALPQGERRAFDAAREVGVFFASNGRVDRLEERRAVFGRRGRTSGRGGAHQQGGRFVGVQLGQTSAGLLARQAEEILRAAPVMHGARAVQDQRGRLWTFGGFGQTGGLGAMRSRQGQRDRGEDRHPGQHQEDAPQAKSSLPTLASSQQEVEGGEGAGARPSPIEQVQ